MPQPRVSLRHSSTSYGPIQVYKWRAGKSTETKKTVEIVTSKAADIELTPPTRVDGSPVFSGDVWGDAALPGRCLGRSGLWHYVYEHVHVCIRLQMSMACGTGVSVGPVFL